MQEKIQHDGRKQDANTEADDIVYKRIYLCLNSDCARLRRAGVSACAIVFVKFYLTNGNKLTSTKSFNYIISVVSHF